MYIFYYLSFPFLCTLFETYNKNIIVVKGDNHIDVKTGLICITRIQQELQEKESDKKSREKNQTSSQEKRISQEYKNTRILSVDAFLASPDKIRSTRILPECQDLFFQARILYRRNGKRILTDNQENQESGKNDGKNVD